ncbi:mtpn [Symbiodinium natans]|uniref:Mtpn protein n=1 Tax=Symbiodinium natans TaxID=878477 RepID=A0A812US83_9DINO|nr:mtpn [Symbiodinium natans]
MACRRALRERQALRHQGLCAPFVALLDTLELTAVTMRARPEVAEKSKELATALKTRPGALPAWRTFRWTHWRQEVLKRHRETILEGDIDFQYKGNNLLELAVANMPAAEVEEVAATFLSGGADVNSPSKDGYTPLLSACSRGLAKVAHVLLQRGARRCHALPQGGTALEEALAFFKACEEYRAYEREEDLDLGRLCCHLRSLSIEAAQKKGLEPLASARLQLSQAAVALALLGPTGMALTQEQVLAESGLDHSLVDALGPQLWAGWPWAFLTFDLDIPEEAATPSVDFANARSRILSFKLSQEKKPSREGSRNRGPFEDYWSVYSDYICECPLCMPECYHVLRRCRAGADGQNLVFRKMRRPQAWLHQCFDEYNEDRKLRNRKWERRDGRRHRRVPVASFASRGASYSARMARRMPAAYRGHHVEQSLQGGRKKLRKFQLVQEQLRMDTCPL